MSYVENGGINDEKLEKIPDADFDYGPDTPDDVSAERAWGFCDKKCYASKSSIMANVLQQANTDLLMLFQLAVRTSPGDTESAE